MSHDHIKYMRASILVALVASALALLAITVWWWLFPPRWLPGFVLQVMTAVSLLQEAGSWGILISIGLMIVHSFIPFPSEILAVANGIVFGTVGGALVTWSGAMLGAASTFGLLRSVARCVCTCCSAWRCSRVMARG